MTVAAPTELAKRYTADGTATSFAYPFEISSAAHIKVLENDVIDILGTNYTVTGVGNSNGGTVQFVAAPASGTKITIIRNQPLSQLDNYLINESYNPLKVSHSLDLSVMIDQMIAEKLQRALKFTEKSGFVDIPVDDPVSGEFLYWNGNKVSSTVSPEVTLLQSNAGVMVSPADFGAVGNDVTDDTLALQTMFAAVQTAGGGSIHFPYNKTYKTYSGAQALNPLFNFIGLKGVTVDFNGSKIKVYKNFVGTGLILFLGVIDGCANVTIRNYDVQQVTPVTVPGAVEGVSMVFVTRGSQRVVCNNIKLDGGVIAFQASRNTATEALATISHTITLDNITALNSIYGCAFQDSGNNVSIRNLATSKVMRSYFAYGCNNHDAEIVSTNAQSNDVLLTPAAVSTGTPTNALENIKLRYKVMGRSIAGGSSYLTIGQPTNISNGILRNINAEIDFDYTGENVLPTAVTFVKNGAAAQNLLFEGIRIQGGIRSVPNIGGDLLKIFDVAQNPWSGEVARNVVIGPLMVEGSATPTFQINLHPFSGNNAVLTLKDIQFPGNGTWTNQSAGNLAQYNVTLGDRRAREVLVVFTPTWTSSGTQPAIGNGTLSGVFRRYGKTATVTIHMTPGSTTTFGTGAWEFGIPSAGFYIDDPLAVQSVGSAYGFDSGTAHHAGVVVSKNDLTPKFAIHTEAGVAQWQNTVPFTWANGDDLIMTITYPLN